MLIAERKSSYSPSPILLVLFLLSAWACNQGTANKPEASVSEGHVFSTLAAQPAMVFKNQELLAAIHAYAKYVGQSTLKLVVEQRGPQVSMRIEPIISFFPSAEEAPSFYFEDKGKLVMVYTGLEKMLALDPTLKLHFKQTLGAKLGKSHLVHAKPKDEEIGPFYCPHYWRFILDGDSVVIQKWNVFSPSVPEPIEVSPPYNELE